MLAPRAVDGLERKALGHSAGQNPGSSSHHYHAPELKKVLQGLGHLRGATSELSPGTPLMWRYVEMRLAWTATRLPPTPINKEDSELGHRNPVPKGLTHLNASRTKGKVNSSVLLGSNCLWSGDRLSCLLPGRSLFDLNSTSSGCKEPTDKKATVPLPSSVSPVSVLLLPGAPECGEHKGKGLDTETETWELHKVPFEELAATRHKGPEANRICKQDLGIWRTRGFSLT